MDDPEVNGGTETMTMFMRVTLAMVLSAILAGCAATGPKEILVPVATPIAEPPVIVQPFLPIWLLTDEDDANPDKVVRYYVKSLYMQRLHSQKLQCALDAYRIETDMQCPIQPVEDK